MNNEPDHIYERIIHLTIIMSSLAKEFDKHFMVKLPVFHDDRFFTDEELSLFLKVDRRTLKRYRHEGKIPYYKINGRILYKESNIKELIDKNHHPAFSKS